MYIFSRYIFLILLGLSLHASAQYSSTKLYAVPEEDNEPVKILALYQTKEGYILTATTNGLFRFDGMEFHKYEQDKNVPKEVTAMCETAGNQLWLGFANGSLASLSNNKIQLLDFEEGFPKAAVKKITCDKNGIVWIATAGEGLYYYKNKRLYNINIDDGLSDNYVYDIIELKNGKLLASTDRGINILSGTGKNIQTFTSRNGLEDNIVRCLCPDGDNNVWLGMQDAGVACYNYSFQKDIGPSNWNYGQVNALLPASQQVYVATEENGLIVCEYKTGRLFSPQTNAALKKVSCLLRDRENNIWAAGNNQLLRTGTSNVQALYELKQEVAENIHCLLVGNDESIWFNTSTGLMQIRKDDRWHEKYYPVDGFSHTDISALYQDAEGNIWIGTMGEGIVLLNPVTGKQRVLKESNLLLNGNILSITGKNKTVWISSLEGVVRAEISGDKIELINYTDIKSIGSKYVYDIFPDSKNRVWFATDGYGLTVFKDNHFVNLRHPNGFNGNVVYKVVEDAAGDIWYSTYDKGVIKYDGKNFTSFNTATGLSDMNITGLATTGNNVVVLHKNGVDVINASKGTLVYLDGEQGIKDVNTDLNASAQGRDNVYFVANNTIFKYHERTEETFQPEILIDKVQLYLQDIDAQNGHSFKYDENNLSFYYTGIFYSQPEKISYQYKLDGYDKVWISTKDRVQNFPKLLPGTYTFRVKAALNNNFSLAKEASFSFKIKKPFWQQAWFILLSAVAVAALIYFIVKERERRIKNWNRLEREKIRSQLETLRNQINPHFLFNSFNTLISEIEEHPDKAVTYVEHLSDFYRSIVVYREKDLISLEEELNILKDYFFIQQKRYGDSLKIHMLIAPPEISEWCIAPLALQLLIENAIKHNAISKQTPLHIELYINEEQYLVVSNNINKKTQAEKSSGMGLQNVQKRYALLTNKLVTISHTEKYFVVKIPLIPNKHD